MNYNATDWYHNEDLYINKSLIYNSVSIFSLIDNVQSIQYNFSGSTYTTTRKMIDDNEFTRSIFNKIFVKKGL